MGAAQLDRLDGRFLAGVAAAGGVRDVQLVERDLAAEVQHRGRIRVIEGAELAAGAGQVGEGDFLAGDQAIRQFAPRCRRCGRASSRRRASPVRLRR